MAYKFLKTVNPLSATSADPDVDQWLQGVNAAGGVTSWQHKDRIENFVGALRDDDAWPALDRAWLFAQENEPQSWIDLKYLARATPVGSVPWYPTLGYAADSQAHFMNLDYLQGAGFYAENSNSCHGWIAARPGFTPPPVAGCWQAVRVAADDLKLYMNGVQDGATSTAAGLPPIPTQMATGAQWETADLLGVPVQADVQGALIFGGGMDDRQREGVRRALADYMASLQP